MTNYVGTMDGRPTAHKLDAIGWGLFFMWIGIAALANLGWGMGLVGVGFLIIAGQLARMYMRLRFEAFWVVIGVFVQGFSRTGDQ
jgi:energy-coupling factor transporter transmembrane protein EcfT